MFVISGRGGYSEEDAVPGQEVNGGAEDDGAGHFGGSGRGIQ